MATPFTAAAASTIFSASSQRPCSSSQRGLSGRYTTEKMDVSVTGMAVKMASTRQP